MYLIKWTTWLANDLYKPPILFLHMYWYGVIATTWLSLSMTCLGAGGALGTQASGNGCPPCTTSV